MWSACGEAHWAINGLLIGCLKVLGLPSCCNTLETAPLNTTMRVVCQMMQP